MDAATRKSQLKQARESLQRKEFLVVLSHCKAILKEDKSCYEAYVFVGKAAFCLKEYAQAEAAYTRGTTLDPNNPLAWQGLAELYVQSGAWAKASEAYRMLAQLLSADAKALGFKRRAAEAAAQAGLLPDAEALWHELLQQPGLDDAGQLELLCRLADCRLAMEDKTLGQHMAALEAQEQQAAPAGGSSSGSGGGSSSNGERLADVAWASAGPGGGAAAAALWEIVGRAPPSPAYVGYYDALLHRLRMAARAAPVGSMERHSRRADVLSFALHAIHGASGLADASAAQAAPRPPGGCCSPTAYDAALAMLETEGNVALGSPAAGLSPPSPSGGHAGTDAGPAELQLEGMEAVGRRFAHAYPWQAAAAVQLALCSRRRAMGIKPPSVLRRRRQHPEGQGQPGAGSPTGVTDLAVGATGLPSGCSHRLTGASRRRCLIKLLLTGLRQGAASAAGWVAASQMLLEEGADQAALDTAKQGLSYLAARELTGHEALVQAELLLKLAAAQALAGMAGVPAPPPAGYTLLMLARDVRHQAEQRQDQPAALGALPAALLARVQRNALAGDAGGVAAAGMLAGEAAGLLDAVLLNGHVSGGPVPFAALAGCDPDTPELTHQASRCLAQLALAGGDVARARRAYERVLGAASMGRAGASASQAEHWALAEYAALLLLQGEPMSAYVQLEAALQSLQAPPPTAPAAAGDAVGLQAAPSLPPHAQLVRQVLAARYHVLAGHVAWECGGELRVKRGSGAHQHWLSGAAAAEAAAVAAAALQPPDPRAPALQAAREDACDAFAMLGEWYRQCSGDMQRAARCYQRALALDPHHEIAGEALLELLTLSAGGAAAAGPSFAAAQALLEDCVRRATASASDQPLQPPQPCAWAVRRLAGLLVGAGRAVEAVPMLQQVLRQRPVDAALWELLGAAYQPLGKHTAALRSYARALQLSPARGRVYSLVQSGVLQHHQGNLPAALRSFQRALALQPGHPAALQGAAQVLLAQAVARAAEGAPGLAAGALEQAATHAHELTAAHGSVQVGWKLLGDVLVQHADVPPMRQQRAAACAASGPAHVAALLAGLQAQQGCVRAARRAYSTALHLDPTQGLVWGDAAMAAHQEGALTQTLAHAPTSDPHAGASPEQQQQAAEALQQLSSRLLGGGLRLEPASDMLWALAGEVAAACATAAALPATSASAAGGAPPGLAVPQAARGSMAEAEVKEQRRSAALAARAEFCLSRALQLNPGRAPAWAALARLYVAQGKVQLAAQAAERARLADPRMVVVWEAMAALAGATSKVPGDVGYSEQLDAWEHAVGLGGGPESWLGYATGAVLAGRGGHGAVLCCALRASAQRPLHAPAHCLLATALEARGQHVRAAGAYRTALEALRGAGPDSGLVGAWVVGAHGGAAVAAVAAAVQLNLARALARSGDARAAVEVYAEVERGGGSGSGAGPALLRQDAMGLVAYGLGLVKCGDLAGGTSRLETAFSLAKSRAGTATSAPADGAAVASTGPWPMQHSSGALGQGEGPALRRQLLAALLALLHARLAAGRPADALALAWNTLAGLPEPKPTPHQQPQAAFAQRQHLAASHMAHHAWSMLLAAAAAATAVAGGGGGLSIEQVVAAFRQWAAGRSDADEAMLRAQAHDAQATLALTAASPGPTSGSSPAPAAAAAAARHCARAVHLCPWQRRWRLRLAQAAARGLPGPGRAAACLRLASAPLLLPSPGLGPSTGRYGTGSEQESSTQRHVATSHLPLAGDAPAGALGSTWPWPDEDTSLDPAPSFSFPSAAPDLAAAPSPLEVSVAAVLALAPAGPVKVAQGPVVAAAGDGARWLVGTLRRAVHAAPGAEGGWFLLALASLQLAVEEGSQSLMMRRALCTAKAALTRARQALARMEASDPGQGSVATATAMVCRLLVCVSEAELAGSQAVGHLERAQAAAAEALSWAQATGLPSGLPQRQLARVAAARGDLPAAEASLLQACQAGELLALPDLAHLRHVRGAAAGDGAMGPATAGGLQEEQQHKELARSCQLLDALDRLQAGQAEQAREALQALHKQQQTSGAPASAQAATLSLLSGASLALAQEGSAAAHEGRARTLIVEARWAACSALKALAGAPAGAGTQVAGRCLAAAELLLGKKDKAAAALLSAKAVGGGATGPPALLLAEAMLLEGEGAATRRLAAAKVVHLHPGYRLGWQQLAGVEA